MSEKILQIHQLKCMTMGLNKWSGDSSKTIHGKIEVGHKWVGYDYM